jgi:uncharacterized protein (TIGR03000 family)
MFPQQVNRIGRLALAAAGLMLCCGLPASAAPPGGGHGGGGHGGGGHGGGGHGGGGHGGAGHGGGFSHGSMGSGHAAGGFNAGHGFAHGSPGGAGFRPGGTGSFHSSGGFNHSHGFAHGGSGAHFRGAPGFAHRGYYPGFYGFDYGYGLGGWGYPGYYPARYYDYFPQYSPDVYSDNYSAATYSADAYSSSAPPGDYRAFSSPDSSVQAPQDPYGPDPNFVMIGVRVPPDAEIWFEGQKTSQTGSFREFFSPPLDSDKSYTYEIRAKWFQDGTAVEQTRTVAVRAGQHVGVDFLAPPPRSKPAQATLPALPPRTLPPVVLPSVPAEPKTP